MKTNEASIFIFAASIIIGLLISMNISFDSKDKVVYLDAAQYQKAYNERNSLYKDIDELTDEYNKLNNKLLDFQQSNKSKEVVTNELQAELEQNKFLLGLTTVTGQGITITLKDADISDYNNIFEIQDRLIHNFDIYFLINDLKNAGAEAISINGQRVVNTTGVYCFEAFLQVNKVKIAAPFVIEAIGNKENLKQYMLQMDKRLGVLEYRYINVDIQEADNLTIPAYYTDISDSHMKAK